MANVASLLILLLFLWGRSLRFRNLRWHIRLMLTAMFADIALVVMLVIFRDALDHVHMQMPLTLKIHVPIAISTVLLYPVTAWQGYRLYRGDESARRALVLCDRVLVPLRVLTLVTSLMVGFLK